VVGPGRSDASDDGLFARVPVVAGLTHARGGLQSSVHLRLAGTPSRSTCRTPILTHIRRHAKNPHYDRLRGRFRRHPESCCYALTSARCLGGVSTAAASEHPPARSAAGHRGDKYTRYSTRSPPIGRGRQRDPAYCEKCCDTPACVDRPARSPAASPPGATADIHPASSLRAMIVRAGGD
jgi:hypothetical protein